MDQAEFDKFADEYRQLHANNISASGEAPEFFAEYKVADLVDVTAARRYQEAPRILDFGAGVGTSVPYFRKYFPKCDLTCIDVSTRSLEIGAARFPAEAKFVHFDGEKLPFPGESFDIVFIACVLHHISHSEHEAILRELFRVLRADGTLVVFEHNPYNPLTVQAVKTCAFDENAVLVRASDLRRRFVRAGFHSPYTNYRILFPHFLRFMRGLEKWMKWLPLGAQYCIYAKKSA
jgi:ubiquinone/menaquinone biosynthesis C-methylase UbiE